jgi:hypothetical protein
MTTTQFKLLNSPELDGCFQPSTAKDHEVKWRNGMGITYLDRLTGFEKEDHKSYTCECDECCLDSDEVVRLCHPDVKESEMNEYKFVFDRASSDEDEPEVRGAHCDEDRESNHSSGDSDKDREYPVEREKIYEWVMQAIRIIECCMHMKIRLTENQMRLLIIDLLCNTTRFSEKEAIVSKLNDLMNSMGLKCTISKDSGGKFKVSTMTGNDVDILLFGRRKRTPSQIPGWDLRTHGFDLYTNTPAKVKDANGAEVDATPGYLELYEFLRKESKPKELDEKIQLWAEFADIIHIITETRQGDNIFSALITLFRADSLDLVLTVQVL